ncbi:MAG: hypothetical protein L0332_32870 [Chloroflexi bacterium]|nr:hypothetical protein [Chloroflexota bacterium]MCI0646788.1 hypothetical protein [Chloroflexota bacterium]MCI0731497.1 hypothetical protein [Chloroflexota bacterium]
MNLRESASHSESDQRRARLERLNLVILLAFFAVALGLVFWGVARRPVILAREDNPRLVEAELRIRRGRILDTNDAVLAETMGPPDNLRRSYPIAGAGPAVGYYSFRHGTAGVEEGFDDALRGTTGDFWSDFWRYQTLHRPQVGQDVRLTLDVRWQRAAEALLGQQQGAVLLLSLPDAAIRAMSSHPGYDPNLLDEQFDQLAADEDAPLLNRVTQGQYQPGLTLQPFLLAAALDQGHVLLDQPVERATTPVVVNGTTIRCAGPPAEPATWAEVLRQRCPAPMLSLARQWGPAGLLEILNAFGLLVPPELPMATESAENQAIDDPLLAAIGQENLTVSPLQIGLAWAALANEGRLPTPELAAAVEDESGEWQALLTGQRESTAVSGAAAQAILQALPQFNGLVEHATLVLSGPGGSTNAWYLGLAPAGAPRYLVVVVIENSDDLSPAERIGRGVLTTALSPE